MSPTHKFENEQGHIFIGVVVGQAGYNAVWFLSMCDDHKTWMKEPVWAVGVVKYTGVA